MSARLAATARVRPPMPSTRSTCSVRPQLFAAGFHNLEDSEGEHACYLNGHAVRFFELSGIIVSLDPRSPAGSGRVNLNLDDGTGLVECVIWQGTHKVGGRQGQRTQSRRCGSAAPSAATGGRGDFAARGSWWSSAFGRSRSA